MITGLLAQVLRKMFFEFEILNTSRFVPSRIRLKNLLRDKKTGSGVLFWDYPGYSYSGLGIIEYPEYRLPKRMHFSNSD